MRDLMGIMKQAQAMQDKMASLQAELDTVEVTGASGGGSVRITMTAKGHVKSISIDPALMVAEEREILEDLIVAASNDARSPTRVAHRRGEPRRGAPALRRRVRLWLPRLLERLLHAHRPSRRGDGRQ